MKNQDEEITSLEKRQNNLDNNQVNDEIDDEIEDPFKISKNGIENLMNRYLSRKFDDELVYIERKGGIKFIEEALQTNFKNVIVDKDDFSNRKKAFDTNEQEPDEPLSNF